MAIPNPVARRLRSLQSDHLESPVYVPFRLLPVLGGKPIFNESVQSTIPSFLFSKVLIRI